MTFHFLPFLIAFFLFLALTAFFSSYVALVRA